MQGFPLERLRSPPRVGTPASLPNSRKGPQDGSFPPPAPESPQSSSRRPRCMPRARGPESDRTSARADRRVKVAAVFWDGLCGVEADGGCL